MPKFTATTLTEPAIEKFAKAPAGGRIERPDRLAPGLVLRINDKGRKSWVARFRVSGRSGKVALGTWPAMGVAEARERAREARDQAAAGIDPREARQAAQQEARRQAEAEREARRTFADLAEEYIKREVPKKKTGSEIESLLRREIIPALGGKLLTEIRRRDAVRLFDRLVDGGRPGTALNAHGIIKRVFNWAVERDELDASPMSNLARPVEKTPRERALAYGEIAVLWAAWGRHGYPFGVLQKLLLLTGQRRNEVADMQWSELDDSEAPTVWTIPAARAKNGREHELPLSLPARALLAGVPRGKGPFVFSTTDGERPVSGFSRAKAISDRYAAELQDSAEPPACPVAPWRWHDLRRTCRTELARIGVPGEVAERVLNHSGDPLVRTYNRHRYQAEMADALERWGAELLRIVGEREAADNIRRLEARVGA